MTKQRIPNPAIKPLLERGDKAGNYLISGQTEQEFEQRFFAAFAQAKQFAQANVEQSDADQSHLECGIKQAVLSN